MERVGSLPRDRSDEAVRSVRLVVAAGLVMIALGLVVTFAESDQRPAGSNNVSQLYWVAGLPYAAELCQTGVPAPDARRLVVVTGTEREPLPAIDVLARNGSATTILGRLPPGAAEGEVEIPLSREAPDDAGELCLRTRGRRAASNCDVGSLQGCVVLSGDYRPADVAARVDGETQVGRVRFDYLQGSRNRGSPQCPTWHVASASGRRNGPGPGSSTPASRCFWAPSRRPCGCWPGARAMSRVSAVAARPLGAWRSIPVAGRVCAAVAFANALVWSLAMPPFQVPDETGHFAYVQYLAEEGAPPPSGPETAFSPEQRTAMGFLDVEQLKGQQRNGTLWTEREDEVLHSALAGDVSSKSPGGASNVSYQPPVYYALAAASYRASPTSDILDRLFLARLVSVLLAAGTALASFLFVRELLPGTPWAWTAGGLTAALQPLLGFMGGGVNNDAMLFFAAACCFLFLARSFRRGLTTRRALAIGLGSGGRGPREDHLPGVRAGNTARPRGAGLASRPGGSRGGRAPSGDRLRLPRRARPRVRAREQRRLGPPLHRGTHSSVAEGAGEGGETRGRLLREQISYTWQLYAPRLPFMTDQFGDFPLWESWIKGWIGHFGSLDYGWPTWVYRLGAVVFALLALLALRGLVLGRSALRGRLGELASYAVMMLGLLVLVAGAGYQARLDDYGFVFEQARYLLPLLPLFAAVVGLAVRGAGRRFGPPLAAAVVMLALVGAVRAPAHARPLLRLSARLREEAAQRPLDLIGGRGHVLSCTQASPRSAMARRSAESSIRRSSSAAIAMGSASACATSCPGSPNTARAVGPASSTTGSLAAIISHVGGATPMRESERPTVACW